jgi:hypothetical protein
LKTRVSLGAEMLIIECGLGTERLQVLVSLISTSNPLFFLLVNVYQYPGSTSHPAIPRYRHSLFIYPYRRRWTCGKIQQWKQRSCDRYMISPSPHTRSSSIISMVNKPETKWTDVSRPLIPIRPETSLIGFPHSDTPAIDRSRLLVLAVSAILRSTNNPAAQYTHLSMQ